MLSHTQAFNPKNPEAERCRSLNLRPAWTAEDVSGQPNLGSKENYRQQKAGEAVNKQWGDVPALARSIIWKLQPCCSGF